MMSGVIGLLDLSAGAFQNGQIDYVQIVQQANLAIDLLKQIYAATVGYNIIYQAVLSLFTATLAGIFCWYAANRVLKHYAQQQEFRLAHVEARIEDANATLSLIYAAQSKNKKVK
jgi:hypothetical protein